MQLLLQALSIALVVAIGYVSRRASLCTVRAVADAMTHRRAGMLLSFGRAALWAATVAGSLIVVLDLPAPKVPLRESYAWALAGGLSFGAGAAINGGCSLSTLQRLVDGDRSLLVTILAFCAGAFFWTRLEAVFGSPSVKAIVSPWAHNDTLNLALLAVLLLWCAREVFILLKSGELRNHGRKGFTGAPYSSGLVGALLGLAGGVLYTVQDAWSYTNYLRASVAAAGTGQAEPAAFHALLVIALLFGMYLASRHNPGSHAASAPIRIVWRTRLAGGFLMGIGGAIVPGGNDTLVLASIPTLSLQALCAYFALLAGIGIVLLLRSARPAGTASASDLDVRAAPEGRAEKSV